MSAVAKDVLDDAVISNVRIVRQTAARPFKDLLSAAEYVHEVYSKFSYAERRQIAQMVNDQFTREGR